MSVLLNPSDGRKIIYMGIFWYQLIAGEVLYWFLSFTASEMMIWGNNNGCNPHFLIIRLQESVRQKKPTLFKSIRVAQRAANKEMVYFHEHTIDMDMEPSGFPAVLKCGFALESLWVSSGINSPKIQEKSCQKIFSTSGKYFLSERASSFFYW